MNKEKLTPCERIIEGDKYESNDPDDAKWWQKLFKEMEADYDVPIHFRREILTQVLPRNIVNKLGNIYKYDENSNRPRVIEDYDSIQSMEVDAHHPSDETICPVDYVSKKIYDTPVADIYESLSDSTLEADVEVLRESKSRIISRATLESDNRKESKDQETIYEKSTNIGNVNPYKNFFKRPVDRAAVWRPLPQLSIDQLDLVDKAAAIKEIIATNFVEWLSSIGGNDKQTLNVQSIKKMFEVGLRTHAATSLCVKIKEMPSVPDEVAHARFVKALSARETLYRQLRRDIDICKNTKSKTYAFGKLLPRDIRIKAPTENIANKWLHGVKVPKELEDMSAIWKGITNLRSTRGFCNWLLNNPDIPKPKYLEQMGLLKECNKNKRLSLDSRKFAD